MFLLVSVIACIKTMGMPINWGRRLLRMAKSQRPPRHNWVDTQMNEVYLRQLSKRTIDGKEDRAREVYTLYS
jgi:hypothetical protein